ncbi:MAG TPA: choice-of-anchor tandem repeat GloVer-containing protein [Candidatus Eremiobacteraceae bacterium]|nr:choice-of-anchor tandem repeat GloVer-containing protein [Candidatus Eremiobacteraceae bacterium]
MPSGRTSANTESVSPDFYRAIYNFKGSPDGSSPSGKLISVNGTLYGTTALGGTSSQAGTVFTVTTAGIENVIHVFGSAGDGAQPEAGLTSLDGTLYGTTSTDSNGGCGVVFSISPEGVENVIHQFFGSPDGCQPYAPVIAVNGRLFGTTEHGGAGSGRYGTVYRVTTSGVEKVLHSFKKIPDGAIPTAGLVNVNGTLYGTTFSGGANSDGTVFTRTATGGVNVLYSFKGGSDGQYPAGGLVGLNGTLYGTTVSGGVGNGTVFSITPAGVENVIYSFKGNPDGAVPLGDLAVKSGLLYGVTLDGGNACRKCGTVFKITTTGVESVVHTFAGRNDGKSPYGGLVNVGGKLYGTTLAGGAYSNGIVFVI